MTESFEWIEVYEKMADYLLNFKNNRKQLLDDLEEIYNLTRLKYPFTYGDEPLKDIDPFSIFATFNRGITDKNRITIIQKLIEKWEIEIDTPQSFDAIPLVNNMSAWFIASEDYRESNDIEQLWNLFEYAIDYSKSPNDSTVYELFTNEFDKVRKQKVVAWKITFGLFWIRPNTFINLDGKTRDYLKKHKIIDGQLIRTVPTGADYLNICKSIDSRMRQSPHNIDSFADLSHRAYIEIDGPDIITNDDKQYLWINYSTHKKSNRSIEHLEGETIEYRWGDEDGPLVRRIRATSLLKPGDKALLVDVEPDNGIFAQGIVTSEPHPRTKFTHPSHSKKDFVFDLKITQVFEKVPREIVLDLPSFEGVDIKEFLKGVSITDMTEEQFKEIIEYVTEETEIVIEETDDIDFSTRLNIKGLYFENKSEIERQIHTALLQGKNIILTGPPGTGKSKLAKIVADFYQANYKMITASSNWSTYETLGGYHPNKENELHFKPGLFLSCVKDSQTGDNINQWLIIDELNRADIDKAFGSFFSVVTGDSISLPFETENGKFIQLIPEAEHIKPSRADHLYYYPNDWRMLATMNTADKASLFELSYAFMRRFAFINIDVPRNITRDVLDNYLSAWGVESYEYSEELVKLWSILNKHRKMGPAIIEDIVQYTQITNNLTDAILLYIMPQLEGIQTEDLISFIRDMEEQIGEQIKTSKIKEFSRDFFGEKL